jgi:hypothetical protein
MMKIPRILKNFSLTASYPTFKGDTGGMWGSNRGKSYEGGVAELGDAIGLQAMD